MDVCDKGDTFPFLKQLTFYRKEPFDLTALYSREDTQPLTLGTLHITYYFLAMFANRSGYEM